MCNLSEGLWEDATSQGISQGISQGLSQGEDMATIRSLKSIMQKMKITVEEAMNLCDVPEENRERYANLT